MILASSFLEAPRKAAKRNQTTCLVDGVTYTLAYDEENRIETVTLTSAGGYPGQPDLDLPVRRSQAASTKIFQ